MVQVEVPWDENANKGACRTRRKTRDPDSGPGLLPSLSRWGVQQHLPNGKFSVKN